jgi:nicotinamide-nucleotide amidase
MRTELICVGTELLTGKLNTNSVYIGERLAALGLDLALVTTVGDAAADLENVFRPTLSRGGIIIVTGGLGPTFDDLTRETLAAVLGRRLVLQDEALEDIRQKFAKRGAVMSTNNERQAYLIDGARMIANRNGTAPGQIVEIKEGGAVVILLPGPPKEMQALFESDVFPYLRQFETAVKKSFVLHVYGDAESAVDDKIRPIIEAERQLESGAVDFTILAQATVIDIKTSVKGGDEMLVDETLNNLRHEFYEVLGDHIYGEGRQTMEGVVGELLFKHNKTLAVAESCTGGLIAHRVTNVPGSSRYFKQGAVTYANEAKIAMLGVASETLERFGAVSEQVAVAMAEGMKKTAGVDYALSVTGIAGPAGGTADKPVGLVFIGLASSDGTTAHRFQFTGDRTIIRERAANQALDLLRRELLKNEKQKKK